MMMLFKKMCADGSGENHTNFSPTIKGSVQRLSGRKPGQLILAQAEEQSADLILTGARGQSSLRTTLVGSVCTYIMHNARVPVLIVRVDE
ncbi:stress response protein nhaX [Elysia marginata]|uniref:Stress response protein nhaX n=1 Tax=Elysia marginata TaxID=1093978 RepID=A0AAV4I1F7_9GAST|nr:stress response protein nhaX [Elysia marginata]